MKKSITLLFAFIAISIQAQVPNYVPSNGLVAYYPFSGNANDMSGSANNGTINGNIVPTSDRFGNSNSAFSFPGSSTSFINVSQNSSFSNFSEGFTLSAWYLSNVSSNPGRVISLGNTDACGFGFHFSGFSTTGAVIQTNCSSAYGVWSNAITNQSINTWYHLVLSVDFNNGKWFIMQNGIQIASGITATKPTLPLDLTGKSFNIGRKSVSAFDAWNGKIDDIGIWNRALTENEITALYQSKEYKLPSYLPSNGLVAFYPFNGNANDMSGYGNNGSVNGATPSADRFGNENAAYKLDGINDYILVSNKSQLNFNKGTISFWLKTSSNALMQPLKKINYSDASGEQFGFTINNSKNHFDVKQNSNCVAGKGWLLANSTSPINNNQWRHIVGIIDSNIIKFYADGILISQSALSQVGSDVCTGDINIGRNWSSYPEWFDGLIDDVAIWNRALIDDEIKGLFEANICYTNITVTDTLVINIGLLSVNPVTYKNTITIAPNPAKDHITIDCGNLETVTGYQIKIMNSLGQQVFTTPMNQQKFTVPLNTWGGTGLYFVHIVDAQGHTIDVKKIILE
jgi:hypothetical protein